jgi:hypothetical protein
LPEERSKNGDPIDIPLPSPAVEWLRELHTFSCNSAWVLPARKNQWVRSSCKFALCQPTQFLVGGNIRYLLNERSTSLFSYQLHMAVSCENGGFFGHRYWVQQFHEQYARAGQQA